VGLDLGQSAEHTVLPQIRETHVPSTLSSSLCPENAEKASEVTRTRLRWPTTTRKPWCSINRVLYVATLSIGLYHLLEGPVPTRIFYPARRRINL
jgi:hypothetical protein